MKGLILTYLLAYGGAAVALFNPFVGVCIYWIFDIVRPQYMFGWAGATGSFSEAIAIGTIIGWALKGFGNWQFGRGRAIVLIFIASGGWGLLSALAAPDHDVALTFAREVAKRSTMFILAVTLADSRERLKALTWSIVGSAGYLGLEFNLRYLGGFNEVNVLGYGGMDNNSLAIMLVTCLGPAIFMGLYVRPLWQKGIAYACAALIGHTVLLTFSRGGLLGLIVAGTAAALIVPKRPRYVIAMVIALAVGLRFAGPELRSRFDSSFSSEEERDFSAQSRVDLWRDCLLVMQRYPILGAGPDHFPLVAEEFGWPKGKEAHSLWLQVGAEIGVPGVLLLALLYATSMKRMWPLARGRPSTEPGLWAQNAACMVVSSLSGFVVSAQFVTMEGLETPLYVVVIAVGTLRLMSDPVARRSELEIADRGTADPLAMPGLRPAVHGWHRVG